MKRNMMLRAILPSMIVGAVLLTITAVLYSRLTRDEKNGLQEATVMTAQHLSRRLQWWGEARVEALWQLTRVAPPLHGNSPESFRETAQQLIENYDGIQALNWIDTDWVIRYVYPFESNKAALNKSVGEHPDPVIRKAVDHVRQTEKLTVSAPAHLYQGGVGLVVYLPVHDHTGELVGIVNGVLRVDSLIVNALNEPEIFRSFDFTVRGPSEQILYSYGDSLEETDPDLIASNLIHLLGQDWVLWLAPNEQFAREFRSNAATFFLVVMLLATVITPFAVYQMLKRQADLRLNESRYRSLFEGSKDAIYRSTLDGDLLNANQAMTQLLGYPREELYRLKTKEHYSSNDQRRTLLAILEDKGIVRDFAVELLNKSGRKLRCLVTASMETDPISGEPVIQGIIRDITDQVELEERFHQAQKMEALGRLAGGISHDFNNLLTAIMGQVELARYATKEGGNPVEHIDSIGETAARASELTRGLLAFSRKQPVRLRPIQLDQAILGMQSLITSIIGEDIKLDILIHRQCPPIEADPSQIEQVLMNLVVNARDAMPDGGTLTVEVGCDAPSIFAESRLPDKVKLRVRDTGVGMSPEVRARVFEPYFTTKGESKGTGLGLATVFGIVEQLDGQMRLDSQVGVGTTFEIMFNRYKGLPEDANAARRDSSPPPSGTEKILLVEDDKNVLSTTMKLFQSLGYDVVGANGPMEGIRLLLEERIDIDLLVTDVVMPEMSGVDMVERLHEFMPNLLVLFISGHTKDIVLKRTNKKDINFVQKPFEVMVIAKEIRRILDEKNTD